MIKRRVQFRGLEKERKGMYFINGKSKLICITDWQTARQEWNRKREGREWLHGIRMKQTKEYKKRATKRNQWQA